MSLPVLYSGSGLTPNNKISARNFILLLDGMYQDTSNFPIFQGALTNWGSTSYWHNSLNPSQLQWANGLMVKSGSMSKPTPALALVGYFRLKNGDQGAFALMLNQPGGQDISQSKFPDEFVHQLDHLFARSY